MAFLNLKKSSAKVARADHPRYQTELRVQLSAEDSRAIHERLHELTSREGSELRVDFPEGWTLFWKLRGGETRFLLAHPEPEQWVGTLAFAKEHLAELLETWRPEEERTLSQIVPIARMSNLEVILGPI